MHAAASRAGAEAVSSITWAGYDAPQSIATQATRGKYADGAKGDLASFQQGLRATHTGDQPSLNTVLGHSYGSTVIGHAGRDDALNLASNQMVFVGSPGVGVSNVSELNINPGNVYATTADKDVIGMTPGFIHGAQPVSDKFWKGADNQSFQSNPGTSGFLGQR